MTDAPSNSQGREAKVRVIVLGGAPRTGRRINLADLGFRYRVSDEALAEIAAAERRQARVLTTAHLFVFKDGSSQQRNPND
jgi:hypothetical protein